MAQPRQATLVFHRIVQQGRDRYILGHRERHVTALSKNERCDAQQVRHVRHFSPLAKADMYLTGVIDGLDESVRQLGATALLMNLHDPIPRGVRYDLGWAESRFSLRPQACKEDDVGVVESSASYGDLSAIGRPRNSADAYRLVRKIHESDRAASPNGLHKQVAAASEGNCSTVRSPL